ncbi:MAG: YggS family pyridoxal phosphate-dependent enzyme [Anaerolineae bacterium]|nr:YggS family pyridoxal phosphate-dependent enzyme [Anaerolineae bacterium]
MTCLERNLSSVQERIATAARRAGRAPDEVTLVAVTKTQPPGVIRAAYDLGLRHFGENRVGEAEEKVGDLPADVTWHMIGHIQSRKANRIVPLFQMVHSVDSLKIAQRLDRVHPEANPALPVLLEVNVSGEESKYGFAASRWDSDEAQREALFTAIEEILSLPKLQVQGLMTMAPIVTDVEAARPVFGRLRQLRDGLARAFPPGNWHHLSMGMTDDFEVAIEEGATLVRLGRAIFAPDLPAWRTS